MIFIKNHPDQKAIIFGADVARYGLDTPGEVTQGCWWYCHVSKC